VIKKYGESKHYVNRPLCRFDIINYFIEKNKYSNYLEIGVRAPKACFNRIIADHKDGVDPVPLGDGEVNYPITSDEFFELIKGHKDIKYDIIFIDGLHVYEQVNIDIKNSLNHLKENGTIIMHDCSPPTVHHQREEYHGINEQGAVAFTTPAKSTWNGTVWKAYVENRCINPNLTMSVVDTDYGVGILQFGEQKIWNKANLDKCLTYEYLEKNRTELLNLLSVEQFELKYKEGFYE
tara:strand:- start:76 stop:783 length:708 start_codon:yes stop_codon:yes gene_type:complete